MDNSNNTTLTLENSKVFEFLIQCTDLSAGPYNRPIYFRHSIGFAYAGSCLVGLNCNATLNTILLKLGSGQKGIPDLKSISIMAAKVVDYYAKSICNANSQFEALIYGYCPTKKRLERYHIHKGEVENEYTFISTSLNSEEVFLLGDQKENIFKEIQFEMDQIIDKQSIDYWRSPLKTLSKITTSSKYSSIGGGTQLNISDASGCEPYQAIRERSDSDMKFRNIDIHYDIDIRVGNCFIAINGMDYEMN